MDVMAEVGEENPKIYTGLIGCYNSIMCEGVARMLEGISSFCLLGVFTHCDSLIGLFESAPPDFCLFDTFFLKCLMNGNEKDFDPRSKILLIEDRPLTPNELHSMFIHANISGLISRNTNKATLRKAIFKVLAGELWFNRETFEALVERGKEVSELKSPFKKVLTPAELKVISFVCQGLKNRDVAERLFISENTVKTHLYNIYRKLNIKSRAELMKRCMNEL